MYYLAEGTIVRPLFAGGPQRRRYDRGPCPSRVVSSGSGEAPMASAGLSVCNFDIMIGSRKRGNMPRISKEKVKAQALEMFKALNEQHSLEPLMQGIAPGHRVHS